MRAERIGPVQFGLLIFTLRTAISLVKLDPTVLLHTPAVWIAEALGFAFGYLPVWMAARAVRLIEPDWRKGWVGFLRACLGRVAGSAVGWILVFFLLYAAFMNLRAYTDLIATGPMPETPTPAMAFMVMMAVAYAIRMGIEPLARVTEVLMPTAMLLQGILLIMAMKDMDARRLLPLFPTGFLPVLGAALTPAGITSAMFVYVWTLAPHLNRTQALGRAMLGSISMAGMATAVASVAVTAFFGAPQAAARAFPLYGLVRTISVMDFFERSDAIYLVIWTVGTLVTVAVPVHGLVTGLKDLLGLKEYRPLALPTAVIVVAGSQWLYRSVQEASAFRYPTVNFMFYFPLTFVLPAVVYFAAWMRRRRARA